MVEVPEDFFVDIISCNNFLVVSLTNLFANIREGEASEQLKSLEDCDVERGSDVAL